MDWVNDRLNFSAEQTEALYAVLSDIDAIKNAFQLTDKLLPQTTNGLDAICHRHLDWVTVHGFR